MYRNRTAPPWMRGIHVMTDMRARYMGCKLWLACFKDSGKEGSDLSCCKQEGFRLQNGSNVMGMMGWQVTFYQTGSE
jgi:hypothetical protein